MMGARPSLIPLIAGLFLMGGAARELAVPAAVSPGATRGVGIAIADPCPTFSWGAASGATSYELAVYRVGDDGREARPVLSERLASPALSWTPSLTRCLGVGGRYAWSVRAIHGRTPSEWSEPSLFEVVAAASGPAEGRLAIGAASDADAAVDEGSGSDRTTDEESLPASSAGRALALPTAETQLSVDGNVAAVSFSGDGSALALVDAETLDQINSTDFVQKREIDRELELEGLLGDVTNVLTDDETATTAAALLVDGADCPAGEFAAGVSASGAAQGCAVPADAHAFATRHTRLGEGALAAGSTGAGNTAAGYNALYSNSAGFYNTALGMRALEDSTGNRNTAVGSSALRNTTTGDRNIALGETALYYNTEGGDNTAVGAGTLYSNTTGDGNVAVGFRALRMNETGVENIAIGRSALYGSVSGSENIAFGTNALKNTTGSRNIAIGDTALYNNTTGSDNVAIGDQAGVDAGNGSDNIFISNPGQTGDSSVIRIGTSGDQFKAYVAGIRGVTTGVSDAMGVVIDSAGQLGTVSSSRRYKQDVRDLASASDRLLELRPVAFRYREGLVDGERPIQFGLIAEEVAEVFPELVVYDDQGRPETVKYHLLAPLLLNELQKLRARVRELEPLAARVERLEALVGETPRIASESEPAAKAPVAARARSR